LAEGYKAVFIAAGAQASRHIGIPGEEEDLTGLHYGLSFLNDVRLRHNVALKGRTVVIGGGNVAIDVARTALRVGSEDVQVFCLESQLEMPAWAKDVEEALEEGVVINPSWGPSRVIQLDGRVTGVEFVRCLSVFDQEGRFRPAFDQGRTQIVDTDQVVISIGQAPDMSFLSRDSQLERALWGTLTVNENTLATNVPGVFAGGDFTTGPTFVIRAISAGRRAALAIDKYLRRDSSRVEITDEKTDLGDAAGLALEEETTEAQLRTPVEIEPPEARSHDFREVERGFHENQARREATRCLRCDLESERRP
jgi:NADH-quinone oxidoreductase subunit F